MKGFCSKYSLELLCLLLAMVLLLSGCGNGREETADGSAVNQSETEGGTVMWEQISMEKAQEQMASEENYIILDVRRADEFAAGHIPGAVNLANETIGAAASASDEEISAVLPDQEQMILVYCRSGNRSKQASQKLADMGYIKVKEFGGIQDWPGEIETE